MYINNVLNTTKKMRKDEQIIAMYDGKMSAREVCNKLNESGVKVSYHYTANVLKNHKTDNVYTTSDNVHSESDNVYTTTDNICTLLSQIVTKLSQIEARLEALEVCNTRARLSTSPKGNITKANIKESTSDLSISEGTSVKVADAEPTEQTDCGVDGGLDCVDVDLDIVDTPSEEADNTDTPTDDSTPADTDANPDNADQTELDNVDQTGMDMDCGVDNGIEYADVPPTDSINTATVSHAPSNTTSTVSKGDYWASWKKFVEAIPTLSKEERYTYYQKYFKELSKLYQGEELGLRRVKLSNQYHYLIDKADTAFKPDPSAVISIPDTDDPMTWAEQFIICWAQKLRTNRLVYSKQKEYADYYTGQLRQYLFDHNRATDGDLDRVEALMEQYLF